MSIIKTTHSPLALREGFHVVLLRALAERLQGRVAGALGILQASLIGGRSSKSTDTTLRYKIELVGRSGIRPPTT